MKQPVLVVEDDEGLREAVCALLAEVGYDVVAAANGMEALSVISTLKSPFVVVLDLGLPDIPGEEVIVRLRHDLQSFQFAVVVFSGSRERFPGLPDDVFQVLEKPAGTTELPKVVESAFRYLEDA